MFFNIVESIILLPFTMLGWIFGSFMRVTSTSAKISSADYLATMAHNHYKHHYKN